MLETYFSTGPTGKIVPASRVNLAMPSGPDPNQPPADPAPQQPPSPPKAPPPGAKPGQRPPPPRMRRPPPRPRPRKHRSHGNVARARWGVFVVFLLFCTGVAFFLNAIPLGRTGLATPAIFGSVLWTTALLVALWRRQIWARYLLIALFSAGAIGALIMVPNTLDPKDRDLLMAYAVGGVLAVGSSLYLYYSRDIHRLTSRDRE